MTAEGLLLPVLDGLLTLIVVMALALLGLGMLAMIGKE